MGVVYLAYDRHGRLAVIKSGNNDTAGEKRRRRLRADGACVGGCH